MWNASIKKSFRKIFPEKTYLQITNPEGDFTGFEDHELNPTCRRHVLAKENLPKDLTIERSANVNNAFDTKVDDLLIAFQKNNPTHLKFTKNAIVEDILQNTSRISSTFVSNALLTLVDLSILRSLGKFSFAIT